MKLKCVKWYSTNMLDTKAWYVLGEIVKIDNDLKIIKIRIIKCSNNNWKYHYPVGSERTIPMSAFDINVAEHVEIDYFEIFK